MVFSKQNKLTIDKTSHHQNRHQVASFRGIIGFIGSSDGILKPYPGAFALPGQQARQGGSHECSGEGPFGKSQSSQAQVVSISFLQTNFFRRSILGQGFQRSFESTEDLFQQELSRFFEFEQLFNDRREGSC